MVFFQGGRDEILVVCTAFTWNKSMFGCFLVSNIFWTNWLMCSAHREHDQIFGKPRQPALSHPHDHSWPGERRQGLASGEEPRARGSEGGRPRQQDGLRDLPDTTSGYQGGPSSFLLSFLFFENIHLMCDCSVGPESSWWPHPKSFIQFTREQFVPYGSFLIWRSWLAAHAPSQTNKAQYS